MSEPAYRIYPDWKDVIVYDEGEGRVLRLDCDSAGDCFNVSVPVADLWNAKIPGWAHGQREIILARLRGAKCIIRAVGESTTTIRAPDGSFELITCMEPDDRGWPLPTIQIITTTPKKLVLQIENSGIAGVVDFPEPGKVSFPFHFRMGKHEIRVDVPHCIFRLDSDPQDLPVEQLLRRLSQVVVPVSAKSTPYRRVNAKASGSPWKATGQLLLCMMFVACGIWQLLDGNSGRDRLLGGVTVLFFLLCALAPLNDLRRSNTRQIPVPPSNEDDRQHNER